MRARTATFLTSAAEPSGFPAAGAPEFAFVGRSNVGKSSLINTLTGTRSLARVSRTPGRTRLINWFDAVAPRGRPLRLVDLPGYGYANVSPAARAAWRPLVEAYFTGRSALALVIVLVDLRRGIEPDELELLAWLSGLGRRVIVCVTKIDKLSKSRREAQKIQATRDLGRRAPACFVSAQTGEGLDDLWRVIERVL